MAVKPGGRVVLVGIPKDDRTSFTASIARRKGLTILLVRRMKFTYPRAINLLQSGQVDVNALITHKFPLEKIGDAFAIACRREGVKVVVQISPEESKV
jgi:L-iditol 2-dehydrogenase